MSNIKKVISLLSAVILVMFMNTTAFAEKQVSSKDLLYPMEATKLLSEIFGIEFKYNTEKEAITCEKLGLTWRMAPDLMMNVNGYYDVAYYSLLDWSKGRDEIVYVDPSSYSDETYCFFIGVPADVSGNWQQSALDITQLGLMHVCPAGAGWTCINDFIKEDGYILVDEAECLRQMASIRYNDQIDIVIDID